MFEIIAVTIVFLALAGMGIAGIIKFSKED